MPWDLLTFILIGLFAMFQAIQWPDLPRFMDVYYHLSVANGFSAAGGYVSHAFWEYAPVGRPHLYPPLLHFVMLGLSKLGLSWISVGRLVECLALPLFLLALGVTVKRINSSGAAFFSVLIASSFFSLYLDIGILLPSTLAITLGLLALTAVHSGRTIAGAILLGLAFYSHIYMAGMISVAVAAYGLCSPGLRARAFAAILFAVILAAPLFGHILRYGEFFSHISVKESRILEIHPLVYPLAAAGLILAVRGGTNWSAPAGMALAMLPLLFTHNVRFLGGYGMIGFIWLGGIGLYLAGLRFAVSIRAQTALVGAALLIFFGIAPVLHMDTTETKVRARFFDSTITHFFLPDHLRTGRSKEHSIYGLPGLPEDYGRIAAIVSANSGKNDIIWADSEYQGAIVALLAGRATSSATMREIRASSQFDAQALSRVLIWFKRPEEDIRTRTLPPATRYNLQLLAETDSACVFLNPAHCPEVMAPAPLLRSGWIAFILLVLAALAALDILRGPWARRNNIGNGESLVQ